MSIIGSLAAQAFFDSKKIIKGQMSLLESELSDLGLPMPSVMVLKVGDEVTAGEAAKETMKLFGGNLRVDHVVQAGIETPEGPIAMIQQYSRANAFPAEFRMKLPYPAPAAVSLHKGILSKSFEPHDAQADDPVAKALCEALDDLHCWIELEWSQDLPGNMKMDVPWGCQVIPGGDDHCILLVQTARIGFLTEVLGVKATLQIGCDRKHRVAGPMELSLAG